jgi:NAD(P)-dependent dehydrogenase (short-subunit alcohol dehydrogenase family)
MSQTILITGANRGIGLALTAELLKEGRRVLAAMRHLADPRKSAGLEATRAGHRELLEMVEMDVSSEESVKAAAARVAGLTNGLDVLVNNAAVFPEEGDESIFDMKLEHFREAFETNVLGVIRVTRAFVPLLEKGANPRIVNISSGAGSVTAKNDHRCYGYAASKAALNMVTRGLAAEFRPRGICVVAMTPGWVKTEMGGPDAPLTPEQSARAIARAITTLTMEKTSLFLERTGGEVKYGW